MANKKTPFDTLYQDATSFGREGFEAFVQYMETITKGTEDIVKTSMNLAQESAEKQSKFFKETMSCKTISEWTNAQNKMAQASFDDFMSGTTKITELTVKVLTDATAPLNEQVSKTIQKASTSMAA